MDEKEYLILKTAILNEIEGETFYQLAADNVKDPDMRGVFLYLAKEEQNHQQILKYMLEQITAGKEISVEITNLETKSPGIFKLQDAARTVDNLEISAVSTGILMEKASVDYYRQAASTSSNPNAKNLYENLISWEMGHLDELEKMYDFLRQNWFDQQGFSTS
ncbi:rubrerythrin [hydrocarbon metagenome]|uniref:Rubrerythrin n=1 Tax=hydrocarbon metagenome TaxID=938273 RepID=A0A0W8E471_9ZZZZ